MAYLVHAQNALNAVNHRSNYLLLAKHRGRFAPHQPVNGFI